SWMPETEQLIFLRTLWRLLFAGFGLLLMGIPFHFWLRPLIQEAAPLAVVFVLGLSQLVLVAFAGAVISGSPVLAQTDLGLWLRVLGLATMVAAALLLFAARETEQAIAYAVLLAAGVVLATLGAGATGVATALTVVLARSLALTLVMVALQLLRQEESGARPWWLLVLGYGAISLLGLPLTP